MGEGSCRAPEVTLSWAVGKGRGRAEGMTTQCRVEKGSELGEKGLPLGKTLLLL